MSDSGEASERECKGYERVGRLLYGLQRSCGGIEGLQALQAEERVDVATRQRSAALADRYAILYARLVRDAGSVDDADVEQLLADARALDEEVARRCGSGWMWRAV